MEHYEIEDIRSRLIEPKLDLIFGLTNMWGTELNLEAGSEELSFTIHIGIVNRGTRVSEVAMVEIGLDLDTSLAGSPPIGVLAAGGREVSWLVPGSGSSTGTMMWRQFYWTPQNLGTRYYPLFATEDPVHAFHLNLTAKPDRKGRAAVVCWRLQSPDMRSKSGLVAFDYRRSKLRVKTLDWPLAIAQVVQGES